MAVSPARDRDRRPRGGGRGGGRRRGSARGRDRDDGALPIAWLDTPPAADEDTLVVVTEALLPLAVCPDVIVRRAVEEKLSVVERFMIEVALELGDVVVEDVEELVGLPAEATERIAAGLCDRGVLVPEGGAFGVEEGAARDALDREALVTYREGPLTFVMLPRSGDVLAYESASGPRPPLVERLQPVARAPVPEPFRSTPLVELLDERVRDRRVAGLPDDVVAVVSAAGIDPWRDECPVYRGTARIRRRRGSSEGVVADVHLYGDGDAADTRIDLSQATGILGRWLAQADALAAPELGRRAWEAVLGAGGEAAHHAGTARDRVHRWSATRWVLAVGAAQARRLHDRGRRLGAGGGLEITAPDGTTKTAVAVRFSPADREAVDVFATEDAVDRLVERGHSVTPADVTEAIAAASAAFGLDRPVATADDVRRRIWRRGRHDLVYRLRAEEDFAYG